MAQFRLKLGIVLLLLLRAIAAHAADPALLQTQAVLNDPAQRAAAAQSDPAARAASDHVKSLGLDAQGEAELYQLSGEIFQTLVEANGNNADPLESELQGYLRDPAALERKLTPGQKAKIKKLSEQLPGVGGAGAARP